MSSLKSLKHWLRRVLTVLKFYFFWGQIISFYDCSETLISHLILDIWSSEKLHLDRSLVFCEFQKQIKSLKLLNLILKTVCPRVSLGKISGICQMGRWPPILDPHRQPLLIDEVLIQFFFCFMRKRHELYFFEEKLCNTIFNQLSTGKGKKLNKFTSKMDR